MNTLPTKHDNIQQNPGNIRKLQSDISSRIKDPQASAPEDIENKTKNHLE